MGRRFSKKKGGMPAFGNRGDPVRGRRVPRLLPQSPQDMSLDPRVPEFVLPPPPPPPRKEVIFTIGSDEPPQRPSRSLNPSVPEFVLPPPPILEREVVVDIGRDDDQFWRQGQVKPPSRRDNLYYPATRFERLQPYHDKRFKKPLFDSRYPGIKFADTTHFSGAEIRAKELRDIQEGIEKEDKEKEEMIGLSLLNQLNQTDGGKRERERKKKSSRRQTRQKKQQQQRRHRSRRHSTRKYKK